VAGSRRTRLQRTSLRAVRLKMATPGLRRHHHIPPVLQPLNNLQPLNKVKSSRPHRRVRLLPFHSSLSRDSITFLTSYIVPILVENHHFEEDSMSFRVQGEGHAIGLKSRYSLSEANGEGRARYPFNDVKDKFTVEIRKDDRSQESKSSSHHFSFRSADVVETASKTR
jgi:hypothetical protein